MTISARSVLMAGIATVTASAVLIAPSVEPLPRPKPAIQLAAEVQPLASPTPTELTVLLRQILLAPGIGTPPPPPPTEPFPTPASIASGLEGAYHAIEPWVQYGFELAQYALGWVPYVGWLSGQVMIFYYLGEGIVHAIVHNTLDWLNGQGSFAQNLGEGIRWSIDTLIQFGINEWNYFLPPLPPLPPIPCIFFCRTLADFNAPLETVRAGLLTTVTDLLKELSDRIPLPRDDEEPEDLPGVAAKSPDLVSKVSSVPETVIESLKPAAAEDEVAGTLADPQPGPQKPRLDLTSLIEAPGNIIKGAVQAQRGVRGAAAEATAGESQSTVGRAHGPVRDAVTNTATTVTKRVTETSRGVANAVKKPSDDAPKSIKKATDDTPSSVKKTKPNGG
jgi:hypothetical protein